MAQASPKISADESAWVDKVPFECALSVPMALGSGYRQSAETDESSASSQSWFLPNRPYSEDVRLAMRQAEAQEYGLAEDDSGYDPIRMPNDILAEMGVSPDEIGQ